jgi:hypothetical protein
MRSARFFWILFERYGGKAITPKYVKLTKLLGR